MSRIFVTGDTHGDLDRNKLYRNTFKESKKLTKNDYLIILGDVAMRWHDTLPNGKLSYRDKEMIEWYEKRNFTTLFIDGNHENHKALNEYPVTEWNGGKVHQLSDTVYHLMRGQIYTIDGKTFFTMGGATSIDAMYRIPERSWWPEEMPSRAEYEEAMDNLEKHNMTVDYVLTHCCGTQLLPEILMSQIDSDELTQFFKHLEYDFGLQFKCWYFGHHHKDKDLDNKHRLLYQRIIEITE